jgi:hypothetical protein
MSRKRSKNKRRACSLCKPHKRGHINRWSPKQLELLRRFERTMHRGDDWGES